MTGVEESPAVRAARIAQEKLNESLDAKANFRLEAGAGAGKTYSLVEALKRIIARDGKRLLQADQRVACITYTEVAKKEIAQDIEQHPAIVVETIHAFCWGFMSQFQQPLRQLVSEMEDRQDKIKDGGGVGSKRVEYQLGFFGVDEQRITLSHDDIPMLMSKLISKKKFRDLLTQAYPVIFIDEYQDTDRHFMSALTEHYFATKTGPLIGLFGDNWQTIYRGEFALVDFPNVQGIDKGANFRSVPAVVNVLNQLRPELKQEVKDPDAKGEARFFHANSYTGERTKTAHSKEDLPDDVNQKYLDALFNQLKSDGWDFAPDKTKVLMLTHSAIAARTGYPSIVKLFDYSDEFIKKGDPTIEFFADTLEPIVMAYQAGKFGEMFHHLGRSPTIRSHSDKVAWRKDMDALIELRKNKTIGDVIDHLKATQRPRISDRVSRREEDLASVGAVAVEGEAKSITKHRQLRLIAYKEVIDLITFIEGSTPFATQHSVKGAQFENVLVVLGGGWNHYNWPQLFELLETQAITSKNDKGFYRARNLFYVAISRPMTRLAVLATQTMSPTALKTAGRLFGTENVRGLPLP